MALWNELTVTVPAADVERASAICCVAADDGLYVEDYSDLEAGVEQIAHVDLIDEELLARDREHACIHLYLSEQGALIETQLFLEARLRAEGIPFTLSIANVREEDWANAWKKYYHAQKLTPRLAVCPSWEDYTPGPGEAVLRLDPGMAFGTGTHETTRLCLGLLEGCVTPETRLLDVGTGSGILSLGALLLGAQSAFGVDLDPVAVRVARENAERNGLSSRAEFVCGNLTDKVRGRYDVVTANIVADVILLLLSTVQEFLVPGGVLIVSGILQERAGEILSAAAPLGLLPEARREEGGWSAIQFRAP